jgi:hypothetical protein
MSDCSSISVDLARREVTLGDRVLRLEPTNRPDVFRLPDGHSVRVVTFDERSRAVREALTEDAAAGFLIDILRCIAVQGEADTQCDAVMLALAGGGQEAPSFDATGVEAAQIRGWDWRTLSETPAIQVDMSVTPLSSSAPADEGWKRFVFRSGGQSDIESLCIEMAERLLARGVRQAEPMSHGRAGVHRDRFDPGHFAHSTRPHAESVERNGHQPAEPLVDQLSLVSDRQPMQPAQAVESTAALPGITSRADQGAVTLGAESPAHTTEQDEWNSNTKPARVGRFRLSLPAESAQTAGEPWKPAVQTKRSAQPAAMIQTSRCRLETTTPKAERRVAEPAAATLLPKPEITSRVLESGNPSPAVNGHDRRWPPVVMGNVDPTGFATPSQKESPRAASKQERTAEVNWLEEIAHALEAECDLRGLDT